MITWVNLEYSEDAEAYYLEILYDNDDHILPASFTRETPKEAAELLLRLIEESEQ